MRTLEDEVTGLIAVDLAVLQSHQKRGFAGLDQYRRQVEVRGVQEIAVKIADSFAAYAIFDGTAVLRYPAITPFLTQTLHSIPLELRREACDRDRIKAERARDRMARMISTALLHRYRFEHLGGNCAIPHVNWDKVFKERFGVGQTASDD